MAFNPLIHHRRTIRLQGYDYSSPGAYFITIASLNRQILFGEIVNGEMQLNTFGEIVSEYWATIPDHFLNVELDEFVIMPDHIHGIIILHDIPPHRRGAVIAPAVTAPITSAPTIPVPAIPASDGIASADSGAETAPLRPSLDSGARIAPQTYRKPILGQVVAYFKYGCAKQINALAGSIGAPVWQRNYWEHIIRDDDDLSRIREYIRNNPAQWETDIENG
jgi:putative transposase